MRVIGCLGRDFFQAKRRGAKNAKFRKEAGGSSADCADLRRQIYADETQIIGNQGAWESSWDKSVNSWDDPFPSDSEPRLQFLDIKLRHPPKLKLKIVENILTGIFVVATFPSCA